MSVAAAEDGHVEGGFRSNLETVSPFDLSEQFGLEVWIPDDPEHERPAGGPRDGGVVDTHGPFRGRGSAASPGNSRPCALRRGRHVPHDPRRRQFSPSGETVAFELRADGDLDAATHGDFVLHERVEYAILA